MRSKGAKFALVLAVALSPAFAARAQQASPQAEPQPDTPARAQPATEPDASAPASSVTLTIATWGGAYGQSQRKAYFDPFTKQSGHQVKVVTHGRDSADVTAKLSETPAPWDVVDLALTAVSDACKDDLLEPLDTEGLAAAPDGSPAQDDFLPEGLQKCGVASVAWSAAIVYNRSAFAKNPPKSLKDVFDPEHFEGKRALPKGPQYTLELALLADGVAPADVYSTLESEEGLTRAFAALDRIKDQIVWWESAQEPFKLLANGGAAIALGFNGRIFSAIVRDHQPLEIVWDGQIYDLDLWAIPKSAENKDAAKAFVKFATAPERLAAQTRWFPYGPMRKSALALVGKHAEADVNMADFLPTTTDNMKHALRFDGTWWQSHEKELGERFEAWLTKSKEPPEDSSDPAE